MPETISSFVCSSLLVINVLSSAISLWSALEILSSSERVLGFTENDMAGSGKFTLGNKT